MSMHMPSPKTNTGVGPDGLSFRPVTSAGGSHIQLQVGAFVGEQDGYHDSRSW